MGESAQRADIRTPNIVARHGEARLRETAVAIDPPAAGAIGIQELLRRFESFVEAEPLLEPPYEGSIGVRELLARLANLAEAGYFSPLDDIDKSRK